MYQGILQIGFGRLDEMRTGVEELKVQAEAANNFFYLGEAYNLAGGIARFEGRYDASLANLIQAVAYFEKVDSLDGRCRALSNLAGVLYYSKRYPEAKPYSSEAVRLARSLNNPTRLSLCLISHGNVELALEEYDSALAHFQEAEAKLLELEDTRNLSNVYNNLADVYFSIEDYDRSLYYARQARVLNQQTGNYFSLVYTYLQLGELHSHAGDYAQAAKVLAQAVDIAKERNWHKETQTAARALAECKATQGNYQEAYRFEILAQQMGDSLVMINNASVLPSLDSVNALSALDEVKRLILQKESQKVTKTQNVAWVVASFFMIVAAWLGYRLFMQRELFLKNQQREETYQARLQEYAGQERKLALRDNQLTQREATVRPLENFRNQMYQVLTRDIRTPLVALISLQKELIQPEISVKQARDLGRESMHSLHEMYYVLQACVYWVRVQSQGLKPTNKVLENQDLLQEAVTEMRTLAAESNRNLLLQEGKSCEFVGDEEFTNQVIRLVLFNAIKLTPANKTISCCTMKGEGRAVFRVVLEVEKRNEELQNLWTTQQLSEMPPTLSDTHMGLTLWLALQLIVRMEGNAWEEYEEGLGQTLRFALPFPSDEPGDLVK